MKKIKVFRIFLIVSLSFGTFACSNSDNDEKTSGNNANVASSQLAKPLYLGTYYDDDPPENVAFKYDEQGRITYFKGYTFTYDTDKITSVHKTELGGTVTRIYNIQNGHVVNMANTDGFVSRIYTYNNNDELVSINHISYNYSKKTTEEELMEFTWSNGNVVKMTYDDYIYYYEFTNDEDKGETLYAIQYKPLNVGYGYDSDDILIREGYFGKRCKNLVKETSNSVNEFKNQYEYEFNENGFVKNITRHYFYGSNGNLDESISNIVFNY